MRQSKPRRLTVVRYTVDGKRVAKGTPGAVRHVDKTDTYYAWVGGERVSLETTDQGEAWTRLRKLLREAGEYRSGLRDQFTDAAARPLAEHAADYCSLLVAKGTSEKRADLVLSCLTALAAAAGWLRITQITGDSCLLALARVQAERRIGPRTCNEYLAVAKQFTAWLCRPPARLQANPLIGLEGLSEEVDVRHARRPPTDDEIGRLMAYLHGASAKTRRGMTGPQRALGYRLCMATGLRAGELRTLERRAIDLKAGTVTVAASFSKNKRRDVQHLPPWLVAELRDWLAAGGGLWDGIPERNPGPDLLRPDLDAAGVAWSVPGPDGAPLFFDFHSFRHWYLTWAANCPGISPKSLQALARHHDPALTLRVYAKARTGDVRALVDGMPELPKGRNRKKG